MSNDKPRQDPQPEHGKGPPDGKGQPVDHGRPVPRHGAWAFWSGDGCVEWIGPRHTNFGDGSICAFGAQDQIWTDGGDPTALLDLYSVWAVRHLHLEIFGRWPGRQYTLTSPDPRAQAYYRRIECLDAELCACGSTTTYAKCCKARDLQVDFVKGPKESLKAPPGGFPTRHPPPAIVRFAMEPTAPPRIRDLLHLARQEGV